MNSKSKSAVTIATLSLIGLVFLGLGALPANASPSPSSALANGQTWRGDDREAYNRGYNDGNVDANRGKSSDYRRYRDHYNSRTERAYRNGYEEGYDDWRQIRERRGQTIDEQREAYESGYAAGKRDYRLNYGKNATRHRDMFDSRTERSFRRGYEDGFEAKQISTGTFSPREKEAYDNGVRFGLEDFRNRLGPNYQRHRDQFDRRYESDFSRGYREGYDKARDQRHEAGGDAERASYDAGFSRGQDDFRQHRSRDYRRYRRDFDSRTEQSFRRGYDAGYEARGGGFGATEQSAYDEGYRLGREDRNSRSSRDYRRWRQYYDSRTESAFRRGYDAGYDSR